MTDIFQSLIDKLDLVRSSPLTFIAFLALVVVIALYIYKRIKKNEIDKLTSGLEGEEKRKILEKKYNTEIDPNTSPQEWLENQKLKNKKYLGITGAVLILFITAMVFEYKSEGAKPTATASITGSNLLTVEDAKVEKEAKKVIGSYLSSLEGEVFEGKSFFASEVEQFYTMEHTTPEAIEKYIIRDYYPNYINRSFNMKPLTWKMIEKRPNYGMFTLQIEENWTNTKTNESVERTAKMKLKINNQYKIVYWNEMR